MKNKLQNVFGVTENGANNVIKACFTAILVFIAEMAPIGLTDWLTSILRAKCD